MTKFRKLKKIIVKKDIKMDESFSSEEENHQNFWDLFNSSNPE
jgi:hypothetical protein